MKISNAITYAIFPGAPLPELPEIESGMQAHEFVACGPSQSVSIGFAPPRGENCALIESVGGQWIAKLLIETKSVPASALKRAIKVRVDAIEQATGRKPGKKETRELKEEVQLSLLPQAFPRQAAINVWIDPVKKVLVLDTASQSKADEVVTTLVKAITNMALMVPVTVLLPDVAMAGWLHDMEPPAGFTIDRDCELKAHDESKATVRYSNHALDTDEVVNHIKHGMRPTKLAMTWEGRVSFVLTDAGTVRSITYLDGTESSEKEVDVFDADVALATGTLALMLAALKAALGGVAQAEIGE